MLIPNSLVCPLFAIMGMVILQACSHSSVNAKPEPAWLSQFTESVKRHTLCKAPDGIFSVKGTSSDNDNNYLLHEVLFEDKLAGYPVEQVQISHNGLGLRITGILAGVPLEKSLLIHPVDGDCDSTWYLKVDTGEVNSQLRTEALLWTGGLILPISESNEIYLMSAEDGALLLHVRTKAWVLGALSIPFKIEEEFWLRYDNTDQAIIPINESNEAISSEVNR